MNVLQRIGAIELPSWCTRRGAWYVGYSLRALTVFWLVWEALDGATWPVIVFAWWTLGGGGEPKE